jgi:ribonuclease Z
MTPWFLLGRDRPMELWGPVGSKGMVAGMRQMYAFDIAHRTNPFNLASNLEVTVHEIEAGPIYSQDGLTVTAIPVWHDDGNPAFGFKVEVAGRSVVLSGDTTYSEALAAAAAGADVVVHNVVAMSDELSRAAEMKPVLGKLTTPEQAARLFGVAKPRLAVLSHIVKKELPGAAGDRTILRRIRAAGYSGPLVMGHDRMVITIGDRVDVARPRSLRGLREADRKATYQP